jgi:hypothetical protein
MLMSLADSVKPRESRLRKAPGDGHG